LLFFDSSFFVLRNLDPGCQKSFVTSFSHLLWTNIYLSYIEDDSEQEYSVKIPPCMLSLLFLVLFFFLVLPVNPRLFRPSKPAQPTEQLSQDNALPQSTDCATKAQEHRRNDMETRTTGMQFQMSGEISRRRGRRPQQGKMFPDGQELGRIVSPANGPFRPPLQ
jgi:hypothetical protein